MEIGILGRFIFIFIACILSGVSVFLIWIVFQIFEVVVSGEIILP